MSLLVTHSLSPVVQRQLSSQRITRRAKAVLSVLRVRNILGLTDEDVLYAVSVVLERTVTTVDHARQG